MTIIELNPDELSAGSTVGCRRHIMALQRPDKNFPDTDNIRWQTHIEGACAEMAVSKAAGVYWTGCGLQSQYDVGLPGVQVRAARQASHGLILRHSDSDDDIYVLVYAHAPHYRIRGWLLGSEGKVDAYLDSNARAQASFWKVPAESLRPLPFPDRRQA